MTTPNRMRIRTSVLLAGLAIGSGLLTGCAEEKAEAPAAVIRPVKVVEIAPAATTRTLSYSGSVKSHTEMNLGFRVAGKLIERKADIGDRVKKGEVLARLDPTDYQLAVQSAEADLRSAQKALETADLAIRRAKTLFAQKAVPKAQVEQAQLSYDQAAATRTAAQSALEQAKNQLAYAELTSDRDGIVSAVSADRGQVVSAGSAVLTVVADDEKEVQIAVPETEISEFSPGKTVTASFWADTALALTGKVREVSGSADPQSRTFSVRVSLPANDHVLIGMTAMIEAETHADAAEYAVPLTALAEKDGAKIVWTVDPAKATVHARPVEVGAFTADGVGVTSGLKAGDLVVAAGTQFMRENLTVKLPDVGALAENILN
ncbi:efflux RND transporter periplasmic adaptor subunit [Rhizobium sp. G21]|uniref:efflux RND transporter periplasmic adaptor subunit n=1 Tax=Rhizobium sp. G21 TaxID=2758439 RepID=UPI001602727B|nr:efflux RND transporter periplasmic adaptor subunit [Rhizobium sp. G21]MBB1251089.1 efflux RND transporter periplasmic adaptor subunit [Rhizobium sp. G21]